MDKVCIYLVVEREGFPYREVASIPLVEAIRESCSVSS